MDEGPFQNSMIHERVVPTYALGAGPVLLWERGICSAMYDPTCSTHRPPVPSGATSAALHILLLHSFGWIPKYIKIRKLDIFFFLFFFKFYFIFKLYIIVLVLPNIKMNPPQAYMCSPS